MNCDDQGCPLATYFEELFAGDKGAFECDPGVFVFNIDPDHRGCRVGRLLALDESLPGEVSPYVPWQVQVMSSGETVTWENQAVVAVAPHDVGVAIARCAGVTEPET